MQPSGPIGTTPGPAPRFIVAICAALRLTRPPGMLPEPLGPSVALSGTREKSRSCIITGSRVECDAYNVMLPRSSAMLVPNSASKLHGPPSLAEVSPNCVRHSNPSKSSRRMKFTAPAMASEPYTADAPPVMTSTLFTSALGMVDRSTLPAPFAGMNRRPLTSVSVRVAPRPRRLAVNTPEPPAEFTLELLPADNCGSSLSTASTVVSPDIRTASSVITVVGLGALDRCAPGANR